MSMLVEYEKWLSSINISVYGKHFYWFSVKLTETIKVATLWNKNWDENHWHLFQSSFHIHRFFFVVYLSFFLQNNPVLMTKQQVDDRLQKKIKNVIIHLTSSVFISLQSQFRVTVNVLFQMSSSINES